MDKNSWKKENTAPEIKSIRNWKWEQVKESQGNTAKSSLRIFKWKGLYLKITVNQNQPPYSTKDKSHTFLNYLT